MHFNTCNKLLEEVNNFKRRIEDIQSAALGLNHPGLVDKCSETIVKLDELKDAIRDARTV